MKKILSPREEKAVDNIHQLRLHYGLTQAKLGELVFVTRQAVSKWESKNGFPYVMTFIDLAKVFHVSPEQLCNGNFDVIKSANICSNSLLESLEFELSEQFVPLLESLGGMHSYTLLEEFMMGTIEKNIFSQKFIVERCYSLGVSLKDYCNINKSILKFIEHMDEYLEVVLWFSSDAHSQVNLLTVLAMLGQKQYCGIVTVVLIDEKTSEILLNRAITNLDHFLSIYNKVMIEKVKVDTDYEILNNAIDYYLEYHLDEKEN